MRLQRKHLRHPWVAVVAIMSLAVLETTALSQGVDGTLFVFVVGAICGIAGYTVRPVP